MNESEWFNGADPTPLLTAVQVAQRRRAVRFFCCACCRRLWDLLPEAGRESVETAERFASGHATRAELDAAHARAGAAVVALPAVWDFERVRVRYAMSSAAECSSPRAEAMPVARALAKNAAEALALDAAVTGPPDVFSLTRESARLAELRAQADLVRELFGNPNRPAAFSPDWRTDTVLVLARQMDEAREYSALPILADALQDAGCDNTDLLDHCRDTAQAHARGCWAVELALGRTEGATAVRPQMA